MQHEIESKITSLQQMSVNELRERFIHVIGETTRSRNRTWLIRRIAWRLQAIEEDGLSERARQRAQELTLFADARTTPPRQTSKFASQNEMQPDSGEVAVGKETRLPAPGSLIMREFKGRHIEVRVTD